ncbi:MAG: hypothetical protein KAX44_03860, partial [Candidatus Brocadiae bacterium]|nr:hypothetical protein [Candidatus Brocadiia bacterium]
MGESPGKDSAAEADTVAAIVEAMLFASDSPLTAAKMAQVGELGSQRPVKKAIETLNNRYEEMGCAF